MPAALEAPKQSPIQVPARSNVAQLQCLNGNWYFQNGTAIGFIIQLCHSGLLEACSNEIALCLSDCRAALWRRQYLAMKFKFQVHDETLRFDRSDETMGPELNI